MQMELMAGALMLLLSLPRLQAWTTPTATKASSIAIAPPRASREWKQMASIEVDTFDDFKFWEVPERKATERLVAQQYIETATRMKGNKYALLVATLSNHVVGMVEMGVVPGSINETQTTIGVLCVSRKCQRQGVGAMLLEKCEKLAVSKGWNETMLYVEVDPNNAAALCFFEKHGFVRLHEEHTRMVKVRRRLHYEEKEHIILSKDLTTSDSL
jgi:ribosomal protein S18 acetylase RimI-like enzyme